MGTTFIYALCEPGTRTVRYIGKSNNPKSRFSNHLNRSIKVKNHLGYWLSSLGERPSLIILCEVPDDQWETEERRYISAARMLGMDLVNATDGGEGMHNPSVDTRAKMSAAKTGKSQPPRTPEHCAKLGAANTGKIRSLETRAKQSAAHIGGKHTPEHCAKISASNRGEKNHFFGKTHPEEVKAKISASRIGKTAGEKNPNFGKTPSDETRARQSESQKRRFALNPAPSGENHPGFGKPQSPETIAKRSAALTGKTRTPEQCAAMSAAKTGEKNPMFGKRFSPEHSANLKAAQQLRRAREKEQSHE